MAKEITRYIRREVERELWARSAGRCQFEGCNRLLFKSPITQERVNISEKAHIYSFSETGPRGLGPFITNRNAINEINNLMLVCRDCHNTIDQDKHGERYSAELLLRWKANHERRISVVTGIEPHKKTHVILYGANIGEQTSRLQPAAAMDVLFPEWYPSHEQPISLSMAWAHRDSQEDYWRIEERNLVTLFERTVQPLITEDCHFSIFALAPMPLLIKLGALLTDKIPAQVYQLHREPQTWKWLDGPKDFRFHIHRPESTKNPPALVLSLSDHIDFGRITSVLGNTVSIWSLTIDEPDNDFLKSKQQLSLYRRTVRKVLDEIGRVHGKNIPISIFPTIPVACAVELGRVRMPKADADWRIFDHHNGHNRFIHAVTLGASQ